MDHEILSIYCNEAQKVHHRNKLTAIDTDILLQFSFIFMFHKVKLVKPKSNFSHFSQNF
jgi:hypothetical protein